jgi:two-component system, chemotaxis family, CheB/CheR fusion protein
MGFNLDIHLKVRRFTTRMTKIVNLIPGDIGRPITDLAFDLIYPALVDDAHAVLENLTFKEKQVNTLDGRWFGVRIMPYRTTDNRIDGIVITFTDITASKSVEMSLRQQ